MKSASFLEAISSVESAFDKAIETFHNYADSDDRLAR